MVYADGEKRYILSPDGLQVDMKIVASADAEIQVGNAMPLRAVPLGTEVHNLELIPGKGGQIARGAGAVAIPVAKEGNTEVRPKVDAIKANLYRMRRAPDICNLERG